MNSLANLIGGAVMISAAFLPLSGLAGPVVDKAVEIEGFQGAADDLGAVSAARDLLAGVWEAAPGLGFSEAVLIGEPATGYGVFNPRPDNKLKLGEPFLIYIEPVGLAFASPGEGLFSTGFFVDLKVVNAAGEVLGEVQNVAEQNLVSRHKTLEYQANLTFTVNGIPPGLYVLHIMLRDKNSAKTGSFETPVEMIE